MVLTEEEFKNLTQPLVGLPVSLPWKGHGSAIFFELGTLAPVEFGRRIHSKGEAGISVEWDWRVEAGAVVLFGSSSSRPKIVAGILALKGETIEEISVSGLVPELEITFSNGHRLKSMVMVAGDPKWSVKLPGGKWIYARNGRIAMGDGTTSLSKHEEAVFALAEKAALRWGISTLNPTNGNCASCGFFVPLDGEGHLLDYGCCVAQGGPFDGRAVERSGGCSYFVAYAEI